MTPQDFIHLMITQLKNQDPTQPMSNEQLLQQMTDIGQLESTDQLQSSMTTMTLQNNIGAAANLLGKSIVGMDDQKNLTKGVVNGVLVQNNLVYLTLDSGANVQLGNVTSIAPAPATTTAGATAASSTTAS